MIGAIVGDYIGSAYEFAPTKEYNFPLVTAGSSITDDSIMSLAVADAILKDEQQPYFRAAMLYYGKRYPTPKGSYGNSFMRWLNSPTPEPYNSFGNGSAMRVSAVGWAYETLEETQAQAAASAAVTHNHPEGIKGAVATATAIWLARKGYHREAIMDEVQQLGYDLGFTIIGIKPTYGFDETCQGTVPAAIKCFLESYCYEDCVRMAVSLGGDADTLACIAGGIAEAYFGADDMPNGIANLALATLPADLLGVYMRFSERFCNKKW